LTAALAWLLGSKLGRWGAFALLAVLLALIALKAASRSGERKAMAKVAAARIKSLQTALRANNEITQMSAADRRAYVARWLRDGSE
tara:strand:+ start:2170 stop:2427 length:258 start_codon:yes stop_codon:yes gene_type:complete